MNLERNSGKIPISKRKNNRGGVSSSSSKNLSPRFRVNTNNYTHVNGTCFISPGPVEFNSVNEVDHEIFNRCFTNFEEELDEVETNEEDEETPTPTSLVTELLEQDEVPPLPTFSNVVVVRVKKSLVWKFLIQNDENCYLH